MGNSQHFPPSSWTKLFAFAHRKYLLFVRIRYGQHDNIATIKTQNPTPKGGICASKGLFLPLKTPFLGLFWGVFKGFLQKRKILYCWILAYYNYSFVFLYFCVFAFYKCEPASVRQLKQVSLRSLTRSFDDVPSSKELTLGLPQINLGILSLNRKFQHDNIATIKTQNPTPKGGILCFKRLVFATENTLFGAFLGCF